LRSSRRGSVDLVGEPFDRGLHVGDVMLIRVQLGLGGAPLLFHRGVFGFDLCQAVLQFGASRRCVRRVVPGWSPGRLARFANAFANKLRRCVETAGDVRS
jgi:hypothetical protein